MNVKLKLKSLTTWVAVGASTLSVVATDKLNSNDWAYTILSSASNSFSAASTNIWRPTFDRIPAREQSCIVQNDIRWGKETNHMAAGLILQYSPDTNRPDVALFAVLRSSFTNNSGDGYSSSLWLLPVEHRYQMTLRDREGHLIPRTEWGVKCMETFMINMNEIDMYHGYQRCFLKSNHLLIVIPSPLLLRDYFQITNAGKYHLEFEIRAVKKLFVERKIEEYHLPVTVRIEIRNP